MSGEKEEKEETTLDPLIHTIISEMAACGPGAPEYPKLLVYLERMETLKLEKSKARSRNLFGVSPDTFALVLGNLLGILVIVAYEQKHVMGSKGLALLLKAK